MYICAGQFPLAPERYQICEPKSFNITHLFVRTDSAIWEGRCQIPTHGGLICATDRTKQDTVSHRQLLCDWLRLPLIDWRHLTRFTCKVSNLSMTAAERYRACVCVGMVFDILYVSKVIGCRESVVMSKVE